MADNRISKLLPYFLDPYRRTGYAILTFLAWVVVCDGDADDCELFLLHKIAHGKGSGVVFMILDELKSDPCTAIDIACDVLNEELNEAEKRKLLHLVMLTAIADGVLTRAETDFFYLVASKLRVDDQAIALIYREITGQELPGPSRTGNGSPPEGCGMQCRQCRGEGEEADGQGPCLNPGAKEASLRLKSIALLNVSDSPGPDEVRAAYRRLAGMHDPDQFRPLGEEAVKAAEILFFRISRAYSFLRA